MNPQIHDVGLEAAAHPFRVRVHPAQEPGARALAGVDVAISTERGAVHGFLNEIGDAAATRTSDRFAAALALA